MHFGDARLSVQEILNGKRQWTFMSVGKRPKDKKKKWPLPRGTLILKDFEIIEKPNFLDFIGQG